MGIWEEVFGLSVCKTLKKQNKTTTTTKNRKINRQTNKPIPKQNRHTTQCPCSGDLEQLKGASQTVLWLYMNCPFLVFKEL